MFDFIPACIRNSPRIAMARLITLAVAVLFILPTSSTPAAASITGEGPMAFVPPGKCRFCEGSGKCQDCWPAGSKVNTAGLPCIACGGSGKCSFCGGTGVCYTCGGHGFVTGCPDCSKVLKGN